MNQTRSLAQAQEREVLAEQEEVQPWLGEAHRKNPATNYLLPSLVAPMEEEQASFLPSSCQAIA